MRSQNGIACQAHSGNVQKEESTQCQTWHSQRGENLAPVQIGVSKGDIGSMSDMKEAKADSLLTLHPLSSQSTHHSATLQFK